MIPNRTACCLLQFDLCLKCLDWRTQLLPSTPGALASVISHQEVLPQMTSHQVGGPSKKGKDPGSAFIHPQDLQTQPLHQSPSPDLGSMKSATSICQASCFCPFYVNVKCPGNPPAIFLNQMPALRSRDRRGRDDGGGTVRDVAGARERFPVG